MPEISFVFGPRNSFFFDCPQTWKFHEIPHTLRQLFNSSMSPAWRIASPYCLALAPQIDSPEPIWYAGCKTLDGEDKLFHSQTYFDVNYPDLARWIKSCPNAARSCFVTFGQNFSYFACAPGHGSIWAGIPSDLENRVKKSLVTPTCVGIGMKDAWFVLFSNGDLAWNFKGHYSGLNKILVEAALGTVNYVAISPYNKQHYFIAFQDRTVKYDFQGAPPEWMRLMTEVFDLWAVENSRMQHTVPLHTHQLQAQPYAHAQQVPAQTFPQPQSMHIISASRLPMAIPVSPQSVPNSPLPVYTSPVQQNAVPNVAFVEKTPHYGVENLPVELPGNALLSASNTATGLPEKEAAKKRRGFLSKLF